MRDLSPTEEDSLEIALKRRVAASEQSRRIAAAEGEQQMVDALLTGLLHPIPNNRVDFQVFLLHRKADLIGLRRYLVPIQAILLFGRNEAHATLGIPPSP